jgi:CRP/FNR family cyclic AMP-dependent transcriptional regulator
VSVPLESVYLFQEVGEQSRRKIARIASDEQYSPGACLFQAGDPADCLYILVRGSVRLTVSRRGLLSYVVGDFGEVIGWSSMAGSGAYTSSAECLVPVTVMKIAGDALDRILDADPASGLAFYRRLARLIGKRLTASYGATLSMHSLGDTSSFG